MKLDRNGRRPGRGQVAAFMLLFSLLLAGAWLISRPTTPTVETTTARQAQADALGLTGNARLQYVAEPGSAYEYEEENLLTVGDYWAHRVSYPTGVFDAMWLVAAAEADKTIERAIPAGRITYNRANSDSPLALDPHSFTFLGPQPLQMNGCQGCFPYGKAAGRTNVIASDPVDPTIAYAGSDGGGVWKTENCCDANTTWTPTTDDPLLASIAIGDIIIDPNDHNTIYAGTGDLRYGSYSFGSAGLLKSEDGAATWTILGADVFNNVYPQPPGGFPQYQAIGKVQVDPRNSQNLIVGTKTGLFFSYDAGLNWDGPCYTNAFTTQRQDITGLLVSDNGSSTDLYAAVGTRGFATTVQPDLNNTGANGIYKSTVPAAGCPAGWTLISTDSNGWPSGTGDGNPANDQVGRIDLAMSPSDNNVIYAQVGNNTNSSGTLGVWRTTDGGVTWTQRATTADFISCTSGIGQTWYNAGMAVDPNNPDVVFLSMIDLYRSVNGADTFNNLTCGYNGGTDVHVDHHARTFVGGSSSTLLVGSDGGAYVSLNADAIDPNAVAFINLNETLGTIEFYSGDITANFATASDPGINAGAQDNGSMVKVWSGTPSVAEWQLRTGGDGMFARIEPIQGLRWYQESQNGNLKVSTTGPFGSYATITGGWSGDRKSFVFPYEIDRYNCGAICDHMIAGSYRVWESIQGGIPSTSWYANSPDLTKNTLSDRSFINQLSYAVSDGTIAIVGTNDGNVWYGFSLGQGVANSATWVDVTGSNSVLPNRPILDVTTHPTVPTTGYAAVGGFNDNTPATPGHVFEVTCNANCSSFTWADKSGNLPNVPVDSILANPNFPQQVFAGTDWGLYFTNDITEASPTWYRFNNGLPSVMIWDMAIDRGFTTLAVFTRSRGAYVWPLPSAPIAALDGSALVDNAGSSVIHTFTLTNPGPADSYDLALSGFTWPTTLLTSSPVSVGANSTATIQVQVDIPAGASNGEYDTFDLAATSNNDPTLTLTGRGRTTALADNAVAGLATSGDMSAIGVAGGDLVYQITVTNTGTITDSFSVTLGAFAWATTVSSSSTGPLAPGASATIAVTVTVGGGSMDSVAVTFTSGFDNNVSATVTLNSSTYLVALPSLYKP